ncbi:MAG: hypothetical protein LWW93_15770 [Hyphomicrobiales bacterium]|nr:hypothetical protein [Hyphomicrobiales bacterium]
MPSAPLGSTSASAPTLVGDLRRAFAGKLRTILTIAFTVLALAIAGWAAWPAKYKAVALVALDPQTPRLVSDRADQSATVGGDASTVVSYAEVATSDSFLIPLAKDLKLIDDPEFSGDGNGVGEVLVELRRNLKVTRRGLSYLIDISFTSKDADKAARIANAIAEEIVRRQQGLRRDATSGISEALRSRLTDLRAAVLASEKAVADYRRSNDLLDVSPDGRVGLKRLNSLTEQLGPLKARLEDARARWDKLRKAKPDDAADPSIFRSDRLSELLTRLGDEKRQLAAAARTYGPRHPSVEATQARIASLEDSVRGERTRIVEQAKAEVDVLTEQNAAYEKEIAARTNEQLATDQKEVVLQDLMRQAQADRQIYEQFLARQKTTQEQSDLSQPEAVVVSSASPPTRSTRPGLSLVGLAGLVGGLGAGVLWVLFGRRPTPPTGATLAAVVSPAPTPAPTPEPARAAPPAVETAPPSRASEPRPFVAPPTPDEATPASPARITPSPFPSHRHGEPRFDEAPPIAPTREVRAAPEAVEPTPAVAPIEPPPPIAEATVAPAIEPFAVADPSVKPVRADEVDATEVAKPSAGAPATSSLPAETPKLSARRHDPAQRLRRMLRVLTEHDVPLVADLTRPGLATVEDGLDPFVDTLAAHLAKAPGLTLTVVGEEDVSSDFAEALAEAVEARGHRVMLDANDPAEAETLEHDLAVEVLPAGEDTPAIGAHPFALLVVETSKEAEDQLDATISLWGSDPERVVVAAFVPAGRAA